MSLIKDFRAATRFHDVAFVDYQGSELLLVACEDGKVRIYKDITASEDDAKEEKEEEELSHIAELVGHSNR
jgi:protein MAK11